MTPDSHPILARHPKHSNIVIGAGFSGTEDTQKSWNHGNYWQLLLLFEQVTGSSWVQW